MQWMYRILEESTKQNHKRVMQSRSRIQTTGPNNRYQLRDYSKSSNRSENRPLIYVLNNPANISQNALSVSYHRHKDMKSLSTVQLFPRFFAVSSDNRSITLNPASGKLVTYWLFISTIEKRLPSVEASSFYLGEICG